MLIFYGYVVLTVGLSCWLGFKMHKKLDRYDWHFHRSDIWFDFWLRLILWPMIALHKPGMLFQPAFKFDRPWEDAAECARQRIRFMESPPPCGPTVLYSAFREDDKERNGIFYFSAANVQVMAEYMRKEHTSLEGMNGAAHWTSLRDESLTKPTEVPELLVNFDHIAEELIEAGHGQVKCLACEKVYSVSELERKSIGIPTSARSGWIYANYICPARHSLLLRQVMHVIRRMPN